MHRTNEMEGNEYPPVIGCAFIAKFRPNGMFDLDAQCC